MKKPKSGFSLIELCIVMAIMLTVTALAFPSLRRTVNSYRLNSSANAVKDMLQRAQTAARSANEPYYAQVNALDPLRRMSAQAANGVAPGRPLLTAETEVTITLQAAGPGNINDLINAMGGIVPAPPGTPIGFNARGLPCVGNPANPYLCPGPTGFIWFMQSPNGDWAAVTVSPAGRIRSWHRISTNANNAWE
jgi:prepilin-type N-terminal cleavage/methylation domain-containing protein